MCVLKTLTDLLFFLNSPNKMSSPAANQYNKQQCCNDSKLALAHIWQTNANEANTKH